MAPYAPVLCGGGRASAHTGPRHTLYRLVTRSLDQGRSAGLVSVLGVETGNFVHVMAAALGLSAILVSSVLAFTVVKYLGGGYLVYLGLRRIFSSAGSGETRGVRRPPDRVAVFRQGVLVAVLNPKTALFFFAFLPQFVDTSGGSATGQLLTMGCLFVGMAMVSDGLYALLAGTAGRWLQGGRKAMRAGRFLAGGVYIGLGVAAALSDTDFH